MSAAVRLSPSGPNLTNASGGAFNPGPGARLRLVEGSTTIAAGTAGIIPTALAVVGPVIGSGAPLLLVLNAPSPSLKYRATVLCDVINPSTNVLGEVQLYLETSVDNVTFTEFCSNTHIVNSSEVAPAVPLSRQIRLDLQLVAGSVLGVTSATPNLFVRAKVSATSGGGIVLVSSLPTPGGDTKSVGTVLLQFEECF